SQSLSRGSLQRRRRGEADGTGLARRSGRECGARSAGRLRRRQDPARGGAIGVNPDGAGLTLRPDWLSGPLPGAFGRPRWSFDGDQLAGFGVDALLKLPVEFRLPQHAQMIRAFAKLSRQPERSRLLIFDGHRGSTREGPHAMNMDDVARPTVIDDIDS